MPLINSATKDAIRQNTDREIQAGKKPKVAYAIAQGVARRARKRRAQSA